MGGVVHKLIAICGRTSTWIALVAPVFAGCGGSSSTTYTVTVTVSPTYASVTLGGTQQFNAISSGAANTAVTWEVNGTQGGSKASGTITTKGLYTAPATFPSPNTVTVTAVSQANTADLANAGVTLVSGVTVSVAPANVNLQLGQTQQFTATVSGSSNTGVTWQVAGVNGGTGSAGTISSSGLYTAPTSAATPLAVSVTAVSDVDATQTASASVVVHGSVAVAVSPNPATVQTFHSQQFVAQVSGTSNTGVTWQVNGLTGGNSSVGTISTSGIYTAPSVVPTAASNSSRKTTTVSITAVSQQDSSAIGTVTVTVVSPNQAPQKSPILLGTSGGSSRDSGTGGACCGGTLGAVVSRGGQQYILSTNHVLARSDDGTLGDTIIQPGLIENSCSSTGTTSVAALSQFASLESPASGKPVVDAALAVVTSGAVDSSGTILGLGATQGGSGESSNAPPLAGSGKPPAISDNVVKSGSATGVTCAAVSAIHLTASVEYVKECGAGPSFSVSFNDLVEISGSGFSAEGDSGALVVEQADTTPVALLIGSSDTDTIANPIADVLAALADPNTLEQPAIVGASSSHAVAVSCPTPSSDISKATSVSEVPVSTLKRQSAAVVLELHSSRLLALPYVESVATGASADEPGQAAIVLLVAKSAPRADLPVELDGIRTRIVETESALARSAQPSNDLAGDSRVPTVGSTFSSLSVAEISRASRVLQKHREALMQITGVQGVGVSMSSDGPGESAILVHIIRGVVHGQIPVEIEGVRTRIRESSRFRASARAISGGAVCSPAGLKMRTMTTRRPGSR